MCCEFVKYNPHNPNYSSRYIIIFVFDISKMSESKLSKFII